METSDLLYQIGRSEALFEQDLQQHEPFMSERIREGRFLVVGGAGSIGSAVVRELFARNPRVLHVIDTSENNLAEMVRDIRSSLGYIQGDFHAYCFDVLGPEFASFAHNALKSGQPHLEPQSRLQPQNLNCRFECPVSRCSLYRGGCRPRQ